MLVHVYLKILPIYQYITHKPNHFNGKLCVYFIAISDSPSNPNNNFQRIKLIYYFYMTSSGGEETYCLV